MVRGYPHTIPSTGSSNGRGTDCPRRGNERNSNDTNGTARASTPGGQEGNVHHLETQLRARVQMMIAWEARREARESSSAKLKQQGVKVSLMAASEITRLACNATQPNCCARLKPRARFSA